MTVRLGCLKSLGSFADASPYVVQVIILLKMAGLDYMTDHRGMARAPKGTLPFIDDDGTIISGPTFIRFYIEDRYDFDFEAGLTQEQKAVG